MIKAIIFDFDGVFAESLKVKADAFSEIYKPYGKEIANKVIEHHHENGGMSRNEKFKYYHKEFLNKAISNVELDKLCVQFSNLVIKKVILSSYVPGVMDFISANYKKYAMFISTGTPPSQRIFTISGLSGASQGHTPISGSTNSGDMETSSKSPAS